MILQGIKALGFTSGVFHVEPGPEGDLAPEMLKDLPFWLFKRGFNVTLGTVAGIEAVMVLTLMSLKQRPLKYIISSKSDSNWGSPDSPDLLGI